jgi:hypothetical protein
MKFAETTGSRSMIAISALSVVALSAAIWAAATPAPSQEPRPVRPMRGCGTAKPRAVAPPVQAHRNGHADTLIAARDSLSVCMRGQSVPVRLALDISATGQVTSVEVKALTSDVTKIDMHVVQCLQHAVSPLVFPAGTAPVRISTHLAATR